MSLPSIPIRIPTPTPIGIGIGIGIGIDPCRGVFGGMSLPSIPIRIPTPTPIGIGIGIGIGIDPCRGVFGGMSLPSIPIRIPTPTPIGIGSLPKDHLTWQVERCISESSRGIGHDVSKAVEVAEAELWGSLGHVPPQTGDSASVGLPMTAQARSSQQSEHEQDGINEAFVSSSIGAPVPYPGSERGRDARPAIVVRGGAVTLPVAHLESVDLELIERELSAKVTQASELFRDAPVIVDLKDVEQQALDVAALVEVMRRHGVVPIAVRGGSGVQQQAARALGMGILQGRPARARSSPSPAAEAPPPLAQERLFTQPVRSGQRVFVANGDLVVVGQVNTGAEVLAAGNIHVYGPLRGRAMAGVSGDVSARILTTCLAAQLVAIAGVYRALEDEDLPAEVREKPAQIALRGDRLVIEPVSLAGDPARKSA
jgi:septum site-determining protein MinC